ALMSAALTPEQQELLDGARKFFADAHPLFGLLAFEPRKVSRGELEIAATLSEDFRQLDGAAEVHGGLLTIILDSVMGFSVFTALDELKPVATINLRSDYVTLPQVDENVLCTAVCETVRDEVAYVNGEVRSMSGDLYARGAGTFMVGTRGPSLASVAGGAR
ncbi:MAG: PaaI family thioesterase, partial [Pseudomonadota bacterium]